MFQKPKQDTAYIFTFSRPRKIPIHMLFVSHPITAIWLDKKKEVIDIKQAKPWQFHISHKGKAQYLIEMNPTTLVDIGDELEW